MRMWTMNPKYMCRRHLLGEHMEMHMFAGCIRKGKSLSGYIRNGLVSIKEIKSRHDRLSNEMLIRGYKHMSPIGELPIFNNIIGYHIPNSDRELVTRCLECHSLNSHWDSYVE